MATFPTDPDGLLYATVLRRLDSQVAALAGKGWVLQAPPTKRFPICVIRPISGSESMSFDGPSGVRSKTLQFVVKGTEAAGFDACRVNAEDAQAALKGLHWEETLGANIVAVNSVQPAGDGYEDYDEEKREFIAIFRLQFLFKVRAAA